MNERFYYRGAFSKVVLAEDKSNKGTYVAVKVIDRKALHGKEESLQNEISVLQRLDHMMPYIYIF